MVAWLLGLGTNLSLGLFVASVKLLRVYFGNTADTATCANQHHTQIIAYAWISQVVFLYIPFQFRICEFNYDQAVIRSDRAHGGTALRFSWNVGMARLSQSSM
jgi:hypothetical protein